MNGSEPRIEIFKPFGEAFELTKKILFQPFNLGKWCVIGFAAFLAGGVNFNFGFRFPFNGGGNWNFRSSSYNPSNVPSFASGEHIQPLVVALIAVIFMIVVIVFFCAVIFFAALGWALISHFMVPIMYRRRCRAVVALRESTSLVTAHPAPVVLYFLFLIVLAIACGIIGCVTTCVTCCIAAIPYVGTVILLPIFVLLRSFLLCFLRQFGPDYDVWAGIPQPQPPPLPA